MVKDKRDAEIDVKKCEMYKKSVAPFDCTRSKFEYLKLETAPPFCHTPHFFTIYTKNHYNSI